MVLAKPAATRGQAGKPPTQQLSSVAAQWHRHMACGSWESRSHACGRSLRLRREAPTSITDRTDTSRSNSRFPPAFQFTAASEGLGDLPPQLEGDSVAVTEDGEVMRRV